MPIDPAAQARLAPVLRAARLPLGSEPVLLPSDSNDVWCLGPVVLRVCWRGDRARFAREAAVTRALPSAVPYPEVVDAGDDGQLAWQVTRAVDGVALATVWPALSPAQQRDAVHQIGQALAALHAHQFPAGVIAEVAAPRALYDPWAIVGADIVPVPVRRAEALLATAPGLDPVLAGEVADRFRSLADVDVPEGATTIVHGDAHLGNALWHDGRVTALLDFEWVRCGPPDLELEPFLRVDVTDLGPGEVRNIIGWLAESCPSLFTTPDLFRRLWLYQLATAVRELFLEAPPRRAETWLRATVQSPDHVLRLLN